MTLDLEAGDVRVIIDPQIGGRIARLEVAGLSLLVPRSDDALRWGSYPMAPWAGRVRRGRFHFEGRDYSLPITMAPHAIHGTTLARPWTHESDDRLTIELGPDWPFAGHAVQQFQVDEHGLTLRLEVHSDGDAFPASLGWHPWFLRRLERGGEVELSFEASDMFACDDDGIPTGEFLPPGAPPWDDCFRGVAPSPSPTLTWPGSLRLAIESDLQCWVVYSEPEHAICVEPMTGPPDALNIAPQIVTPARPLIGEVRFSWERLDSRPRGRD